MKKDCMGKIYVIENIMVNGKWYNCSENTYDHNCSEINVKEILADLEKSIVLLYEEKNIGIPIPVHKSHRYIK